MTSDAQAGEWLSKICDQRKKQISNKLILDFYGAFDQMELKGNGLKRIYMEEVTLFSGK